MRNNYLLLADILKAKRTLDGDSLRTIANQVGISHTELARIENGNRENFSLLTLVKICSALNIDVFKLLMATGYTPMVDEDFSDSLVELFSDFMGLLEPDEEFEDEEFDEDFDEEFGDEDESCICCEHCIVEESPAFRIKVNVVKE